MKQSETLHIILAIFILSIVIGLESITSFNPTRFGLAILFSIIIIGSNILGKKLIASRLDTGVESSIWYMSRYGFKYSYHFNRKIPIGVIVPLIFTALSLGAIKIMTLLTYETTALKRRAAKKMGFYSYTEMTDWHIALIGASGIIAVLLVSLIGYFIPGVEGLSTLAALYALTNLIPFSKLDGSQIFFGSRVLWIALVIITLIFVSYSLILV